MANSTPNTPDKPAVSPSDETRVPPTPLRCFTGALVSSGIASLLYLLTMSIARAFASKPVTGGNVTAMNISVAVRTLVLGMSTMATAIFGIATLGLVALGIQLMIKQWLGAKSEN